MKIWWVFLMLPLLFASCGWGQASSVEGEDPLGTLLANMTTRLESGERAYRGEGFTVWVEERSEPSVHIRIEEIYFLTNKMAAEAWLRWDVGIKDLCSLNIQWEASDRVQKEDVGWKTCDKRVRITTSGCLPSEEGP